VKHWNTERLILGVLWLLGVAALIAAGDGSLGDGWKRYALMFWGATTGWLIRSFIPGPEATGPYRSMYAVAIPLLAIMVVCLAVAVFI
jgi:hypothetical protein